MRWRGWTRREYWLQRAKRRAELEVDISSDQFDYDCSFRVRQHACALALGTREMAAFKHDCEQLHERWPQQSFFVGYAEAIRILRDRNSPAVLVYVALLFVEHLEQARHLGIRRARSGAEMWVQKRRPGEQLNFHWDKDEALRDRFDVPLTLSLRNRQHSQARVRASSVLVSEGTMLMRVVAEGECSRMLSDRCLLS